MSGTTPRSLDVVVSNDVAEVESLVALGYCPVECSVGGRSVVDDLLMDHHGEWSHLESVAVRAYRDHFGARAGDARFVVAGVSDADASFAIAALAGVLPHPSYIVDDLPPFLRERYTADLSALAASIARIDTDPIGVKISALEQGTMLVAWNGLSGTGRDSLSAIGGVALWRALTTGEPAVVAGYLAAAELAENSRFELAFAEQQRCGALADGVLIIDGSQVWGFDVWYGRVPDGPAQSVSGWQNPVVLARTRAGNITVGCPNRAVAEELFGVGGLNAVFDLLEPEGWGGRETVGGSPRGQAMTSEELFAAAGVVAAARL